jgi:hypothetical protein
VAKVGKSKRAVQKASYAEVHPWLATEAHGNKNNNKPYRIKDFSYVIFCYEITLVSGTLISLRECLLQNFSLNGKKS